MKNLRLLGVVFGFLVLVALWFTSSRAKIHAAGATQLGGTCVSFVPREWGTYRGGSAQSGLAFEDSAGTLRFVTNVPCGTTPVPALEVRRPPAKSPNGDN